MSFVHLHVRSEYSIVDSILTIDELCAQAKAAGMSAVALTDLCNLFGMVKFYRAAIQNKIKPIIGTEIWIASEESHPPYYKAVLLCQNTIGYRHLTQLISRAYQEGERLSIPLVKKEWLKQENEGLIMLSGNIFNHSTRREQCLLEWMSWFPGRFYIEIQRTGRSEELLYEDQILALANALNCPVVATNEVVMLKKEDEEAHKARVCIQEGVTLSQFSSTNYAQSQYLKSADEMKSLFRDIPNAISNTVEIAKRCSFFLELDHAILPSFSVPKPFTEDTFLEKCAFEGLENRFSKIAIGETEKEIYYDRLKIELQVINSMGFPGYFLIVADFIQWAKKNQIRVGPGRGSGAGSLVAYALDITDLDPIQYKLLFERFLNPERVSMPDFDIDFCMDNRDRVIDYVIDRYGKQNVSQIATFGTMAAKAVIRDVGRVLAHPYGFVDKIAKLVPFEIGITLEKALEQEPVLKKRYNEEEEVKTLIDLAMKLEGITRNVGKHAGGVVIAPSILTDYAPLYCEKDSPQAAVIQLDKDDVESVGLIKFDFLGLRTLTIIDWAVKNTNQLLSQKNLPLIQIENIPLNDKKTFQLLKKCQTTAVFQLESRGMKELIKRLEPDQFEEIIALVALFRPGPLQSGMVDDFINRKHGRAKVEYLDPSIEPILKPTYGVILYQEQVMQIAQTLAGYTLGGADLLRRAMGKKKPEEMAKQRSTFIEGAKARGVEERTASYIFDLIEKFAGYGFNKSHSAAYALVSYQTAWLKAHYPSAFMAAVLSSDMMHTDKLVGLIEECRLCGLKVIPPDLEVSEFYFKVDDNQAIIYGLGAIKGVGESAVQAILQERARGPFLDLFDFCKRVDSRKVNKRVIEALIKSGAMDCFKKERSILMAQLEEAMKQAERSAKDYLLGQQSLFDESHVVGAEVSIEEGRSWTTEERLQGEKESLGMYFSGHPLMAVADELSKIGVIKRKSVTAFQKDKKYMLAGLIVSIKTLLTRKGDRMAIVMLDDQHERYEVTIFPEPYQLSRELLVKDQLVILETSMSHDPVSGGVRVRAHKVLSLKEVRCKSVKKILLQLKKEKLTEKMLVLLQECFAAQNRGDCQLEIEYFNESAKAKISLPEKWGVIPSTELLAQIAEILGEPCASFVYTQDLRI